MHSLSDDANVPRASRTPPTTPAIDRALMADGRGPWSEGSSDAPKGEGGGKRPGSPWLPPSDEGRANPPRQPRSLDELLRRGGGGAGGGIGSWRPDLPGGRRAWTLGVGALVLLWVLFTSVWRVDSQEAGVITRFGSYARTVGPGVSLTLPAPFERMQRVPVGQINAEEIPSGGGENLVLTSDANIINLAYTVRWSIREPERFLFQLEDPQGTIRAAAESAMRATLANFTLVQAIGSGRADIERQVALRTQGMLNLYRSGVRIESVAVSNAGPPQPVEEAFNLVNAARQSAQTAMSQARADAQLVLGRARGEAGEFDRYYVSYRAAPEVTRRRLYYETMEFILRPSDKTVVESGGVTPYLSLPEVRRRTPTPPAPPTASAGAPAPATTTRGAGQ